MVIDQGFSMLCFSKLFFTGLFVSSAATVPGMILLGKGKAEEKKEPATAFKPIEVVEPEEIPILPTEEQQYSTFINSFERSDFAQRKAHFEKPNMDGPWVKMPWEEGYDWREAKLGWANNSNRYVAHPKKHETSLYKYMSAASTPQGDNPAEYPEVKEWMNDMNMERMITLCNRLWTQPNPNSIRIGAARGWCVDSREFERKKAEEAKKNQSNHTRRNEITTVSITIVT